MIVDSTGPAANLQAVLHEALGNTGHPMVRAAIDNLVAGMVPSVDPPDLAGAAKICPPAYPGTATKDTIGLIIETRCHRSLPAVVRDVIRRCNIRVQLMHGLENSEFIFRRLGDLIEEGRLITTKLNTRGLSGSIYNGLFLNSAFWQAVAGRGKILVFQTDAILCRRSVYRLDDFSEFDFIASWRNPVPGSGLTFSFCGGLSLRDWSLTTEVLDRFSPEGWRGGEDDYFPLFMAMNGGHIADPDACDRFCGQRHFIRGCFGLHQPHFRNSRLAAAVLAYEPRAWRLITPIEKRLAHSGY